MIREVLEMALRKVQGIGNNIALDDVDNVVINDSLTAICKIVEER